MLIMTAKSSQSGRKKAKVEDYTSYLLRLSRKYPNYGDFPPGGGLSPMPTVVYLDRASSQRAGVRLRSHLTLTVVSTVG